MTNCNKNALICFMTPGLPCILQKQIDAVVEEKILEALCGADSSDMVKVTFSFFLHFNVKQKPVCHAKEQSVCPEDTSFALPEYSVSTSCSSSVSTCRSSALFCCSVTLVLFAILGQENRGLLALTVLAYNIAIVADFLPRVVERWEPGGAAGDL